MRFALFDKWGMFLITFNILTSLETRHSVEAVKCLLRFSRQTTFLEALEKRNNKFSVLLSTFERCFFCFLRCTCCCVVHADNARTLIAQIIFYYFAVVAAETFQFSHTSLEFFLALKCMPSIYKQLMSSTMSFEHFLCSAFRWHRKLSV